MLNVAGTVQNDSKMSNEFPPIQEHSQKLPQIFSGFCKDSSFEYSHGTSTLMTYENTVYGIVNKYTLYEYTLQYMEQLINAQCTSIQYTVYGIDNKCTMYEYTVYSIWNS